MDLHWEKQEFEKSKVDYLYYKKKLIGKVIYDRKSKIYTTKLCGNTCAREYCGVCSCNQIGEWTIRKKAGWVLLAVASVALPGKYAYFVEKGKWNILDMKAE